MTRSTNIIASRARCCCCSTLLPHISVLLLVILPLAQPFSLTSLLFRSKTPVQSRNDINTSSPVSPQSPFGVPTSVLTEKERSRIQDMIRVEGKAIKRLPDALIIGVKKGGTRALLEFMKMHPDVRAPGPEIHFFDKRFHRGFEWYRRRMPPTLDGQLTMEKTPGYFVDPQVPGRVYQMNKDMKLILVVRDPVTRALSDYAQAMDKRLEPSNDFSTPDSVSSAPQKVFKTFNELVFLPESPGYVDTSWSAIKIGLYVRHLANWLKYFAPRQILIVSGEELVTRPAKVINKVQRFLSLAPIITERHFFFNVTKGFPCVKKHWRTGRPHCLNRKKGRRHPKVSPSVIQRLREFYRPFNEQFYQLTKLNFGWDSV